MNNELSLSTEAYLAMGHKRNIPLMNCNSGGIYIPSLWCNLKKHESALDEKNPGHASVSLPAHAYSNDYYVQKKTVLNASFEDFLCKNPKAKKTPISQDISTLNTYSLSFWDKSDANKIFRDFNIRDFLIHWV